MLIKDNRRRISLFLSARLTPGNGWYAYTLTDGNRTDENSVAAAGAQALEQGFVTVDFLRDVTFNRVDLYPTGSRLRYGRGVPA